MNVSMIFSIGGMNPKIVVKEDEKLDLIGNQKIILITEACRVTRDHRSRK